MSFKNFFKKMVSRNTHPAHLPYIPTTSSQKQNTSSPNQFPSSNSNSDISYSEAEVDVHTIAGTNITFGTQKIIQVDSQGQAKDLSQTQSHILGSGKLVCKVEDIGGVCQYCQNEALKAFEENLISLEEAQIKSLYDTQSASRCNNCGINTCYRHCRDVRLPDGSIQQFCVNCQKQLKAKLLRKKIIGFLLSPFMETMNQN